MANKDKQLKLILKKLNTEFHYDEMDDYLQGVKDVLNILYDEDITDGVVSLKNHIYDTVNRYKNSEEYIKKIYN